MDENVRKKFIEWLRKLSPRRSKAKSLMGALGIEFEKFSSETTSETIDRLVDEWFNRPPPPGVRKEKLRPVEKRT